MENKIYAVIDTNVIVSALISKSLELNPVKIVRALIQERIVKNARFIPAKTDDYNERPASIYNQRIIRLLSAR